jgi:hypothetical protein
VRRSRVSLFRCLSVCKKCCSEPCVCKCDKGVWANLTPLEQKYSCERSEWAFCTLMNKYKKKDCYDYMLSFTDEASDDEGEICQQYVTYETLSNRSCDGPCRFCGSRIIHHKCNPAIPHTRQFTTRATQWYPNQPLVQRMEEARVEQHLPADESYQMYRGSNLNANPNMSTVITTASSDRVNEYHGPHREIETTTARRRREAMERLERATDPDIMDEQRVNMNRRLNPLVAYIPTSPVSPRSPMSTSSGIVEIVEGPAPEVIDLSIDEIEAMFMSDVADQTTQAAA